MSSVYDVAGGFDGLHRVAGAFFPRRTPRRPRAALERRFGNCVVYVHYLVR